MKVGDKIVIRATAQSWSGITPWAKHFYPVLEDTETRWSETYDSRGSKDDALKEAVNMFLEKFDVEEYICVIGTTQTDMCMDWE